MEIGQRTGAKTCPRCLRNKEEAIREQLKIGHHCDDDKCIFKKEIENAINEAKLSKYCCNCGSKFFSPEDEYCYNCGVRKI